MGDRTRFAATPTGTADLACHLGSRQSDGSSDARTSGLTERSTRVTSGTGDCDAIRAGAQAIVTFNLDDFPTDRLEPYNVEAKHPDDFVADTIDLSPGAVAKVLAEQAAALKNPPRSIAEVLDTLRDQGLVRAVARLRELFAVGDL